MKKPAEAGWLQKHRRQWAAAGFWAVGENIVGGGAPGSILARTSNVSLCTWSPTCTSTMNSPSFGTGSGRSLKGLRCLDLADGLRLLALAHAAPLRDDGRALPGHAHQIAMGPACGSHEFSDAFLQCGHSHI